MNRYALWRIAACFVVMLSATVACGRKTDPYIPESPRPEAIKNIVAVTRDAVAYLTWPIPDRNVEGKNMNPADVIRFRIYRSEYERDHKKGRYRLYTDIDMSSPAPATVRNNVVSWSDMSLRYGQTYGYRIRALTARGGVSQQSAEVLVTPVVPLAVPQGFVAFGADGFNQLTWEPVTTWLDGSPATGFIGYNIYRGTEKVLYDKTPLNNEPLKTPSYKDTKVVNGHPYYYVIRSVTSQTTPWNESPDSEEISATPRKLTPPTQPTGLTVIAGVSRVFLTWDENAEHDIAGYNVYRSTKTGRDYERLNDKLLTRTTFSDESVKIGVTYYYAVTAVDQSGNESAYTAEKKVHIDSIR